jgi:hypothetical protein
MEKLKVLLMGYLRGTNFYLVLHLAVEMEKMTEQQMKSVIRTVAEME